MKFFKRIALFCIVAGLFSCDNEVEINSDFVETTVVYGLLDAEQDTQFVKITRTFLDDNLSAVELTQKAERLYYDSLNVELTEVKTGKIISLKKILLPKEAGLFTTQQNQAYFTTEAIDESSVYKITITKHDGSVTTASTAITEGVVITSPDARRGRTITLINPRGDLFDYVFKFETRENVGQFDAKFSFSYTEILNNDSTTKSFDVPLSTFINNGAKDRQEFVYALDASRFFDLLETAIPVTPNPPKRVIPDFPFEIEVNSADPVYYLYRDVNGPLDGLSQTRPEYTNITNGIGIFASRKQQLSPIQMPTSSDTENYIIKQYGTSNGVILNPTEFRGFDYP